MPWLCEACGPATKECCGCERGLALWRVEPALQRKNQHAFPYHHHGRLLLRVPPPPRSRADGNPKVCFRKALNCLDWRRLEYHQRSAEHCLLPSLALTDPLKKPEPPLSCSPSSMEKASAGKPSTDTLLELGRFEFLHNRSVRRALGFFKACIKQSPWHASAKVRWNK